MNASNGSVIGGLDVSSIMGGNSQWGIRVNSTSNASVFGNTIVTTAIFGTGIDMGNATNAIAADNTIRTFGHSTSGISSYNQPTSVLRNTIVTTGDFSNGISIFSSTAILIGNNVTAQGAGSHGVEIQTGSTTIRDNQFGSVGGHVINAHAGGVQFLAGSTGNTFTGSAGAGRCSVDPAIGTVYFTDGVNCVFP